MANYILIATIAHNTLNKLIAINNSILNNIFQ